MWQASPASSLNVWFSAVPCWSDLVVQALQFLAGETKGRKKYRTNYNDQTLFSATQANIILLFSLNIIVQRV